MAVKLDERATCFTAVLVSCSRDWRGHAEAFLVHGNAYQDHALHLVPHLVDVDWSFGPGREAAATGQPRGLWRSLRARLKALDVLLAAGDTGSAEARSHEPCSDADTRDRTIAKLQVAVRQQTRLRG